MIQSWSRSTQCVDRLEYRWDPIRIAYRVAIGLALSGMIAMPNVVFAHGPTIRFSQDEMKPVLLNLFVGTTVHFVSEADASTDHVVVDETGTVESPPIRSTGDGWHFRFENEGRYELRVRDHPNARATIVVVPKRALPGGPKSASPGP